MSEFLVLKSTEEQKDEGVQHPVDTAYIEDRDGMPIMKAVFDVHHFRPDEVHANELLVLRLHGVRLLRPRAKYDYTQNCAWNQNVSLN